MKVDKKNKKGIGWNIGIDEVGRGALAGPVVVCAAMIINGQRLRVSKKMGKLKDSKKLLPQQREKWFQYFKSHPRIMYAVSRVYPRGIEQMNISQAANLAALRAYQHLFANRFQLSASSRIYLDGGLFLGSKNRQQKNAKTIIKADEKIAAVKIASIIAKVHRDRFMNQLAKKYKKYGFDMHKGYGTKAHYEALKLHGPCDAHRLTFLKKSDKING